MEFKFKISLKPTSQLVGADNRAIYGANDQGT
jgi:hypothetical protein